MHDEYGVFPEPPPHRSLLGPGGRLICCFKGGGGSGAAAEEARLGRLESQAQFEKQFRFNADQAALQNQRAAEQLAATRAASRFTVRGSETALDKARAADEARLSSLTKFGFRNTRLIS